MCSKIKLIPDSIDKGMQNLLLPVTKEVGSTFADLWYLVFGNVHYLAEKKRKYYEKVLQFQGEIVDALTNIDENERVKEPEIQIIGLALEDSKFCLDKDEIRKMFVNLIASVHTETKKVHPSFSGIIKQMDSLEATNLLLFTESPTYPIVHYQIAYQTYSEMLLKNVFLENPACQDIYAQSMSISCLERLGLVKVYDDTYSYEKKAEKYEKYTQTEFYLEHCRNLKLGGRCVVYETYV